MIYELWNQCAEFFGKERLWSAIAQIVFYDSPSFEFVDFFLLWEVIGFSNLYSVCYGKLHLNFNIVLYKLIIILQFYLKGNIYIYIYIYYRYDNTKFVIMHANWKEEMETWKGKENTPIMLWSIVIQLINDS